MSGRKSSLPDFAVRRAISDQQKRGHVLRGSGFVGHPELGLRAQELQDKSPQERLKPRRFSSIERP